MMEKGQSPNVTSCYSYKQKITSNEAMKHCSYFLIYLNKFLNEDLKNKKVQIIELSKNDSNKYK